MSDPVESLDSGPSLFNSFAPLAEFEHDLIAERTQTGLSAARQRDRAGGRPKGLCEHAQKEAIAAEALYTRGDLSVKETGVNLGIGKATLHKYLRHQFVEIGGSHNTGTKG